MDLGGATRFSAMCFSSSLYLFPCKPVNSASTSEYGSHLLLRGGEAIDLMDSAFALRMHNALASVSDVHQLQSPPPDSEIARYVPVPLTSTPRFAAERRERRE